MRKLLMGLLVAAAACTTRTTTIPTPSPATAPAAQSAPRPTLDTFLAAVKAQDLQAMSNVWGDKDGSVRASGKMGREEIERREIILMCYFRHDRYRVLDDKPGVDNERVLQVELTKGNLSRTTNFYLATDGTRWYVRSADLEPIRDLCVQK
ncbi:MAG: hypothetical protein ACHQRK_08535 [Gemmatimonadales bacterium]